MNWESIKVTRSHWLVLAYGAVSGFAFGLWIEIPPIVTIVTTLAGIHLMAFVILLSKMPVNFGAAFWPRTVENTLRILILAPLTALFLLFIITGNEQGAMLLSWILLPLSYLSWREWISSRGQQVGWPGLECTHETPAGAEQHSRFK